MGTTFQHLLPQVAASLESLLSGEGDVAQLLQEEEEAAEQLQAFLTALKVSCCCHLETLPVQQCLLLPSCHRIFWHGASASVLGSDCKNFWC
jgi:hypothetical protein